MTLAFDHGAADPVVALTPTGDGWWDHLNRYSPGTVRRISVHVRAAIANEAISAKVRELIYIGVDSVCTHLYPKGVRLHAVKALEAGATQAEVLELLQLACAASARSYGMGTAVLAEEIDRAGIGRPVDDVDSDEVVDFKQRFIAAESFWEPWMDLAMERAPRHFMAWLDMNYAIDEPRVLEPKVRSLISMALSVCAPLSDEVAVRRHARLAIERGATPRELYEAMQIASGLGPHAFSNAIPELQPLFDGE